MTSHTHITARDLVAFVQSAHADATQGTGLATTEVDFHAGVPGARDVLQGYLTPAAITYLARRARAALD